MNTLEIVLAILTITSFGFTAFSFARTERKKANERANVEIMRQQFKDLHQGLQSIFYSIDAIVQTPKTGGQVTVKQLQNMARIARGQVHILSEGVRKSVDGISQWKFGVKLQSGELSDVVQTMQGDHQNPQG